MPKGRVIIDEAHCKGCTLCTTACLPKVLIMDEHRLNGRGYHPAVLSDPEGRCTGCALCSVICPDACFTVFRYESLRLAEGAA